MVNIRSAVAACTLVLLAALTAAQDAAELPKRDYWPTRAWKTERPEDHGLDPGVLDELKEKIEKELIYSAVIVKDGNIVFEYYKGDLGRDSRFLMYSCTKSFTSALIGICIDKGYIKGTDQKISEFFPDLSRPGTDDRKKRITLHHLLTMTAGFEWSDMAHYGPMIASNDRVGFLLDLPMKHAPGEKWVYSTGVSHLLSAIVQKASGKDALALAREHLFGPIGITSVEWPADPKGIRVGGDRLEVTARDAARFGFLFLNQGHWDGKQVISRKWIRESTKPHIRRSSRDGYGYQWWTSSRKRPVPHEMFFASGARGQFIVVLPAMDMVLVATSQMPQALTNRVNVLFRRYVLKAMIRGKKP